MKVLKINQDYEKLPLDWEDSSAHLIGLWTVGGEELLNLYTNFVKYDTKIRGKDEYYKIDPCQLYIVLTFLHESGQLFTSIRKNNSENWKYYLDGFNQRFELVRA